MVGMKDGRMLEDTSVPYSKLEVHPDTLYVQISVYNLKMADLDAIDDDFEIRITALEGATSDHAALNITDAHGVNAGAINYTMISPTPAEAQDLSDHIADASVHFTIGTTSTQAAAGNHTHNYSGSFAPLVHNTRHRAIAHGGTGDDVLTGTHTISITGSAQTAYYAA